MLRQLLCITVLALGLASAAQAVPTKYPTGLTVFVPNKVTPGFVLATAQDGVAYLISLTGQLVHAWSDPNPPNQLGYAEPLSNGEILVFSQGSSIPGCGFNCGKLLQLDFFGNLVWEYLDNDRFLHHDFQRLSNGNTMILCSKELDRAEISPLTITDDCLVEVDLNGNVVWEWQTADHYDELGFSDDLKAAISARGGDWAHANSIHVLPANTPLAGDPRFAPGNILIGYRNTNQMIVVDRLSGAVTWEIKDATVGQHHAQLLNNNLPGAGGILAFDNGCCNSYPEDVTKRGLPWSSIVEIDPLTNDVTPTYTATMSGLAVYTFFSHFVSSVQKFPNGNMLINEGKLGRLFEVTASGEIVWEYVMPIYGAAPPDNALTNLIYRATKVRSNWLPQPPAAASGSR